MDREQLEKLYKSGSESVPLRDNELEVVERFEGYLSFLSSDECNWGIDPEDAALVACTLLRAEVQLDIRDAISDSFYEVELDDPEMAELIRRTIEEHDAQATTAEGLVDSAYSKEPKLPNLPKPPQGFLDLGPK